MHHLVSWWLSNHPIFGYSAYILIGCCLLLNKLSIFHSVAFALLLLFHLLVMCFLWSRWISWLIPLTLYWNSFILSIKSSLSEKLTRQTLYCWHALFLLPFKFPPEHLFPCWKQTASHDCLNSSSPLTKEYSMKMPTVISFIQCLQSWATHGNPYIYLVYGWSYSKQTDKQFVNIIGPKV